MSYAEDPVPRMLALQAKPSLPGLADDSQVEVLTAEEVPADPPPPARSAWRTSLQNALPHALPWRRWRPSAEQFPPKGLQGGSCQHALHLEGPP